MRYITTAGDNRHTKVLNEQQQVVGQIDYSGWTLQNAHMTTADGIIYDVNPKGFWAIVRTVLKNNMPYAELKPNMGNGIYINFENGQSLLLKKKSWWSVYNYILTDNEGQQIATLETTFKWRGLGYIYDINITTPVLQKEDNNVLPLIMAYSARYLRMRMS